MRVRTGRFEELRSRGKSGQAQSVEVANGKRDIDEFGRVFPPAPAVGRHLRCLQFRKASGPKFAKDGRTSFSLLEVDSSEPVSNPFVQFAKHVGGIR